MSGPYTPNHIPAGTRVLYIVVSVALIAYGIFGLWIDDIFIPGKRGTGVHLHGLAAWLMFAAMVLASLNLLSVVVDHFDQRNNETDYRRFARVTGIMGYTFFGLALAWFIYTAITS